jgi:hypothetical protein
MTWNAVTEVCAGLPMRYAATKKQKANMHHLQAIIAEDVGLQVAVSRNPLEIKMAGK